jgi:hypothetical protein
MLLAEEEQGNSFSTSSVDADGSRFDDDDIIWDRSRDSARPETDDYDPMDVDDYWNETSD